MKILITGATGLTGTLFLKRLAIKQPTAEVLCLVRPSSNCGFIQDINLYLNYFSGDSSTYKTWDDILSKYSPETIIHIASIRHTSVLIESLESSGMFPKVIVIGTTGIHSRYNHYCTAYKQIEKRLVEYRGSYCLLRPTMIYGSHRDKNLHKLIKFCDRYSFFPVFGSGQNLLQPVHADDLAQAILSLFLNPNIEGAYDLSGGTIITFNELIKLVGKLIGKPVRPLRLPYKAGLWSATLSEKILGDRSPVRREQILRLQEDKAYSHEPATQDFGYSPRSLEVGLQQEVEILRAEGIIQ